MKNTITIIVTLLLVLVLFSPLAMADRNGDRNDDFKDDKWEKPQGPDKAIKGDNRIIMYKVWEEGITVTSVGKDKGQFNAFYFTLKLEKGVYMHYNYFRSSFSDEAKDFHDRMVENRTFPDDERRQFPPPKMDDPKEDKKPFEDLGFSIFMRGLQEVSEIHNNVTTYDFRSVNFTQPVIDLIKQDDTVTGLKIRTATDDGIFGLTFYLISTAQYGQEHGISPIEVKYDISITNFPFQADDSRLALENIFSFPEMVLEDPADRRFDKKPLPSDWTPPEKERTLGYDLETLSVFFSWASNVTVDGEDHNVTAEYKVSVDGESTMVEGMTFYYPQGQSILHDPKIGVADLLEIAEDTTEFIELLISWSTGLGIGVILIAAVAVRMKPSKFDWED